jgi:imidazolonepropionase-like amidohydrolase
VKPATDEALEGYRTVLDKNRPVYVGASTVEELRAALELLVTKWKLKVVVVGGDEVRRMTADLAKASVGVIASPRVLVTDNGRPVNLLRELSISGLPAAVVTDAYLGGAELFELLSYAVSRGLSPSAAVRLATGDAARLLGVADRLGTLAPGRDADLILLTGSPFGAGSRIRSIYVGGKEVDREGN